MSPDVVIGAALVVCVGLVFLVVRLTRQFVAPHPIPVTEDWIDRISSNTTNLLTSFEDGSPDLKLRVQHYQLLRAHLQELESDFKEICMALKVVAVESPRDRPDLVRLLVRNQITFTWGMMRARFQLVRFRFG